MFLSILMAVKELIALIGYYSGGSFPPKLKPEAEKECLEKMAMGDEEARNKLIHHNLRLVAHIIKKYDTNTDKEDLISIGTIGLIKGIDTYKPDNGAKLATYVAKCIDNQILMYFRSTGKNRGELSLQEPLGVDGEGNEITMEDILCSDESVTYKVETSLMARQIVETINNLQDRDKRILRMRLGLLSDKKEYSQREIAKMMDISRSYVSRLEKKAITDIKNRFNN